MNSYFQLCRFAEKPCKSRQLGKTAWQNYTVSVDVTDKLGRSLFKHIFDCSDNVKRNILDYRLDFGIANINKFRQTAYGISAFNSEKLRLFFPQPPAFLQASAMFVPIIRLCSFLMYLTISSSIAQPADFMHFETEIPPRESTAMSAVPLPTSAIRMP